MPGSSPAVMDSLKPFIQTDIAYVTVESFIFVCPANSTFVAMVGGYFLVGEMFTLATKIIRQFG